MGRETNRKCKAVLSTERSVSHVWDSITWCKSDTNTNVSDVIITTGGFMFCVLREDT
jgi:hypothetical protein